MLEPDQENQQMASSQGIHRGGHQEEPRERREKVEVDHWGEGVEELLRRAEVENPHSECPVQAGVIDDSKLLHQRVRTEGLRDEVYSQRGWVDKEAQEDSGEPKMMCIVGIIPKIKISPLSPAPVYRSTPCCGRASRTSQTLRFDLCGRRKSHRSPWWLSVCGQLQSECSRECCRVLLALPASLSNRGLRSLSLGLWVWVFWLGLLRSLSSAFALLTKTIPSDQPFF